MPQTLHSSPSVMLTDSCDDEYLCNFFIILEVMVPESTVFVERSFGPGLQMCLARVANEPLVQAAFLC